MLILSGKKILTGSPEMSEYFLAGLKEGGASILKSREKQRHKLSVLYIYVFYIINLLSEVSIN